MPWDHAPGWLLHQEAGGYSARFDGSPYTPLATGGGLICTPDRESLAGGPRRPADALKRCRQPRAQAIAARASASIVSTIGRSGAVPAWMPSGISVQPSTTAVRRARPGSHDLGQRRVGVRHPVGLHQRDRRGDQALHLVLGRHDAVPAQCAQPVLVEPHGQCRLRAHHADRAACSPMRRSSAAAASTMCRIGTGACRASVRTSDARCCTGWRSRRSRHGPVRRCRAAARAADRPPPVGSRTVRSGTRGSDHSTVGTWSWSRDAGVNCVSRTMNCALASGPMPPSTPSTLFVRRPWRQHWRHLDAGARRDLRGGDDASELNCMAIAVRGACSPRTRWPGSPVRWRSAWMRSNSTWR